MRRMFNFLSRKKEEEPARTEESEKTTSPTEASPTTFVAPPSPLDRRFFNKRGCPIYPPTARAFMGLVNNISTDPAEVAAGQLARPLYEEWAVVLHNYAYHLATNTTTIITEDEENDISDTTSRGNTHELTEGTAEFGGGGEYDPTAQTAPKLVKRPDRLNLEKRKDQADNNEGEYLQTQFFPLSQEQISTTCNNFCDLVEAELHHNSLVGQLQLQATRTTAAEDSTTPTAPPAATLEGQEITIQEQPTPPPLVRVDLRLFFTLAFPVKEKDDDSVKEEGQTSSGRRRETNGGAVCCGSGAIQTKEGDDDDEEEGSMNLLTIMIEPLVHKITFDFPALPSRPDLYHEGGGGDEEEEGGRVGRELVVNRVERL